jgi:predicted transcriptional regulator
LLLNVLVRRPACSLICVIPRESAAKSGSSFSPGVDTGRGNAQQCAPMKTSRFLLRGFKRPRDVASQALGKLEQAVLNETWRRQEVSVRDIYLAFDENIAYTTLMTTLDRLYKKKLLTRRKNGRAFVYLPAVSPDEFEQGIWEDVIEGLLGHGVDEVQPVLACIVDTVSERDRELLDELDRLIKEKRKELKGSD